MFIIWLNPLAGKIKRISWFDWLPKRVLWASCQLRVFRFSPVRNSSLFDHIVNLSLTNLVRSLKMPEHWPRPITNLDRTSLVNSVTIYNV